MKTHLGKINFKSAATGIDVGSIEILTCTCSRIEAIKFNHGLNAVLFEDDNAQHLAMWIANFMQDILQKTKREREIESERERNEIKIEIEASRELTSN